MGALWDCIVPVACTNTSTVLSIITGDAGKYSSVGWSSCLPCTSGPAGYGCPAGSNTSVPKLCPAGQYGTGAACQLCSAGTYGATAGLTASTCSGTCTISATTAYYCPEGSTTATGTLLRVSFHAYLPSQDVEVMFDLQVADSDAALQVCRVLLASTVTLRATTCTTTE